MNEINWHVADKNIQFYIREYTWKGDQRLNTRRIFNVTYVTIFTHTEVSFLFSAPISSYVNERCPNMLSLGQRISETFSVVILMAYFQNIKK